MISDFTGEDSCKDMATFHGPKSMTKEINVNQHFDNKFELNSYPKVKLIFC